MVCHTYTRYPSKFFHDGLTLCTPAIDETGITAAPYSTAYSHRHQHSHTCTHRITGSHKYLALLRIQEEPCSSHSVALSPSTSYHSLDAQPLGTKTTFTRPPPRRHTTYARALTHSLTHALTLSHSCKLACTNICCPVTQCYM